MSPRDRLARLLARLRGWLGSDGGHDGDGDDRGSDILRGNGNRAGGAEDGRILVYASDRRTEAARKREDVAERARDRSGADRDDRD